MWPRRKCCAALRVARGRNISGGAHQAVLHEFGLPRSCLGRQRPPWPSRFPSSSHCPPVGCEMGPSWANHTSRQAQDAAVGAAVFCISALMAYQLPGPPSHRPKTPCDCPARAGARPVYIVRSALHSPLINSVYLASRPTVHPGQSLAHRQHVCRRSSSNKKTSRGRGQGHQVGCSGPGLARWLCRPCPKQT